MAGNYTTSGGPPISEAMYNGGTALGQALSMGTADNYPLTIITNGTTAINVDTSQAVTFAGAVVTTGVLRGPVGTVSVPGVQLGAATSGLYAASATTLDVSCNGQQISEFSGAGLEMKLGPIFLKDGTVGAPGVTFASDADCGVYRIGANDLGVSVGGALALEVKGIDVVVGNAQLAQNATTGFFWMPTCATGKPNGTPAGSFTGRVPFVWDTVNKKISVYDGGWIQSAALT